MPRVIVLPHEELCPSGDCLDVPEGTSICDALLQNGIPIEHACEKCCACTTCHVIIKQGFKSMDPPDDLEEDLLDRAWGLTPTSRLSCQAILSDQEVVVELPRYTINHAKE